MIFLDRIVYQLRYRVVEWNINLRQIATRKRRNNQRHNYGKWLYEEGHVKII